MGALLAAIILSLAYMSVVFGTEAGTQTRIFKIKRADAQALCAVISDIKSSEGKVTFDKNTNSIIVVDYPATVDTIASVINELDVAGEQVEIKVLVIDAQDDFFRDAGIGAGELVIPAAQFSAFLVATQVSSRAHLRSQMMLRTSSGSPARLAVSKDEIFGETATYLPDGSVVVSPQRQALGDFLEVVPTVQGDGTITVALRPSSSSLNAQGVPQERAILTQVNVRSGDTVVLGGLESAREEDTRETSFGFLGAQKTKNERRVMMFLTATLMKS